MCCKSEPSRQRVACAWQGECNGSRFPTRATDKFTRPYNALSRDTSLRTYIYSGRRDSYSFPDYFLTNLVPSVPPVRTISNRRCQAKLGLFSPGFSLARLVTMRRPARAYRLRTDYRTRPLYSALECCRCSTVSSRIFSSSSCTYTRPLQVHPSPRSSRHRVSRTRARGTALGASRKYRMRDAHARIVDISFICRYISIVKLDFTALGSDSIFVF